ncbi:protein kinase [Kribbella sp. NBC_01505]|uniref:protein kinase domain-containing protein n=1 Tax=Kribbella sp. NBC_01505 TaxID=2903580 RepID=UPI0038641791
MALEDLAGYSLRRRLGSGSAGTLWQVRDLATGRNAVLKRIPVTAIQRKEQFHDELMVLQRIHHPHVARVLEVRETPSEWLVFSQYVVALSLTKVLSRRGSMPPGEIVTLLSPLAEAINYLHRCGLIHGHLTAGNVLIDVEGRPILTDTAMHSLNITPVDSAPPEPPSTTNDRRALAALALHAGGPATLFTPALFTETPFHHLAARLLTLTTPEPILVGDPDDPPPDLHSTTAPPPDDTRTPLSQPAPDSPSDPVTPKALPNGPKSARRPLLSKLTRQTPDAAPTPNPLSRLAPTPLTKTHVVLPASTHVIGTTHIEPAISWSTAAAGDQAATPEDELVDASWSGTTPPEASANPWLPTESAPVRLRAARPWRRHHTLRGRFLTSLRMADLGGAGSLAGRMREVVGRPGYGVAGAVGLGLLVLVGLTLAARLVLAPSDPAVTASDQTPAPPTTPHSTSAASPSGPTPADTPAGRTSPVNPATPHQADATAPPTPRRTGPEDLPTDPVSPPTPRGTGSQRSVAEWVRTLHGLDIQRAQAFRTLDGTLLDKIYVPGTKPWQSDRALIANYRRQGVRIHGLQIQIDKTTIFRQTPTTVTLRTTDHLTAGQAIDKSGTRTPLPPGTPATRLITLTNSPAPSTANPTWRIATITPA